MENSYSDMIKHFGNLQNPPAKSDYWKRYDNVIQSMSADQKAWVTKQDSVKQAKQSMFAIFLDYLFDQNKDAFVSVADGKYKQVVDDYIDVIKTSASCYVSRAEQLEKENADLRLKLQQIIEGKYEPMATDGSGRNGKNCTKMDLRQAGNSGSDSSNPELFED